MNQEDYCTLLINKISRRELHKLFRRRVETGYKKIAICFIFLLHVCKTQFSYYESKKTRSQVMFQYLMRRGPIKVYVNCDLFTDIETVRYSSTNNKTILNTFINQSLFLHRYELTES